MLSVVVNYCDPLQGRADPGFEPGHELARKLAKVEPLSELGR